MNLTPLAAVVRNPLQGVRPEDRFAVRIGTRIRDLEPTSEGGLIVCRFNDEWLLREHWDEVIGPGDRLAFYEYPQGREGVRLILQVAALVISFYYPAAAPYLAAALAAYNILVPPRAPRPPEQLAGGSIFSTSLAGNTARLDQPIWRICGRKKITPPFAAQPYVEFLESDPANPTVDTDQFYFALFAIGIGSYDVEKAFIGKTPISHFQDVIVAAYLAPGEQPSTTLANVVTSDEVSNLEMPEERYVGGYIASRPGDLVASVGIDIAAAQGLGLNSDPLTVEWQVEAREVDDFGRPLDDWQIIGAESRTAATNTPQRWTNTYTLSAPIRAEIRVVRTNVKEVDPNARDGIQWIGLRAYLEKVATLNADTAHFEVVMRASDQLSAYSQRDFSMIVRGLVRTWDPDTGWGAEVFTRNAMWWLADLWTNAVWGEGLPDARVDLQGIWDIAQTLDARQDRFDYAFTNSRDSWDAAQLIAHSGRCRAFRRGGVYTLARDELEDVPVMAFTSRNTEPKSMVLHTSLPRREQPDGVVVEYESNIVWDSASIECPAPGFSAVEPLDTLGNANPFYDALLPAMENPVFMGLDGITGRFHAMREGIYQAASMALRTSTVEATVEMEGVIVCFMDPILWQPQIHGYGQTGDVVEWDAGTFVMRLSEPPVWGDDPLFLTLQRDDGTLHDPMAVLAGPTATEIYLSDTPDFDITTADGMRERTKYLLGPEIGSDEMVKLSAISDGGKQDGGAQLFDIEALVDDDRVHEADNALLPGPGEIQDPIDDGEDYDTGGGTAVIIRLQDVGVTGGNVGLPDDTFRGGIAGVTFKNNGTIQSLWSNSFPTIGAPFTATISPGQWVNHPVEVAVAALYEIFVSVVVPSEAELTGQGATITGTFDTWLSLGTDRTWSFSGDDAFADARFNPNSVVLTMTVKIRRAANPGSILVSRKIYLEVILGNS